MLVECLTVLYHHLQTLTWLNMVLILVAAMLTWLGYKIIQENLSPLRKIPSPPGRLPLIGHLLTMMRMDSLHLLVRQWHGKYGPVVRFNTGLGLGIVAERVIVYDKDLVKQVLVTNSYKFDRSKFVKGLVPDAGNGLFTSNGKVHAMQRKLINPAFSLTNLKPFVPAFEETSLKLVKLWSSKIKDSPIVEIGDDISHLTLDIIGKTSFGYDFDSILGKETEVLSAFNSIISGVGLGYLLKSQFIPFYKYLPFPDSLAIKRSSKLVNDTVRKVINERRMLRQQRKATDHKDLLNLLLDVYDEETGKGFNDEELQAQVFTFMFAGHETTGTSLSWTLYELARHPEIQDKIRQEIKATLEEDEELTWTKLEQLEYLGRVIKESLRLHAPASDVIRETNQTVYLGDYEIPEGTLLIVPVDTLHMSAENWDNPMEFDPERFMRIETPSKTQYSYLPFSTGPRVCIGHKFATAEMKTILVTLFRNFQISAVPGFEVKELSKVITRPDPSVKVSLTLLNEHS